MKVHRDPISSLDDLPGDLGISNFIVPSKFPLAQSKKVKNETESAIDISDMSDIVEEPRKVEINENKV